MKSLSTNLLFALALFVAVLTGCTPQTPEAQIDGVWRYEAPVASDNVFGGGTVVTERIDMKLSTDGKVNLAWKQGRSDAMDPVDGTWKRQGDLLVLTRPDTSFGVFKIVAVEKAELRVLSRTGKLYRLTRMPMDDVPSKSGLH